MYPTKLVTARIMMTIFSQTALFGIIAGEFSTKTSDVSVKESLAYSFAYRIKADKSQRLFQQLSEKEIVERLLSDKYDWQMFTISL